MSKVLFFAEAMGGGVFTYIVNLSNELVKTHEVYVAYALRDQTPEDYRLYFDKRVHLIHVENFCREINCKRDLAAFFEIRKIAKEVKPNIIHLHSSKAGVIGRLAFNGRKVPLFYTPHGYSFLMTDQSRWKIEFYRIIEKICAKRNCITICCSKGELDEALKLGPDAVCIDNGINTDEIDAILNNKKNTSKHGFTVFTIGRISYQKNPEDFNQTAEAFPDIRFVWIGDGELRDNLTSPNIEVTGWLEREKALQIANDGDAFILTSLWEGLPISLLEAMYMRKICIVSNVIGNRDVINSGINGFVCNNLDDYIAAIEKCIKGECGELIENAYQDILGTYNTKVMSEKYNHIYMNELAKRNIVGVSVNSSLITLQFLVNEILPLDLEGQVA